MNSIRLAVESFVTEVMEQSPYGVNYLKIRTPYRTEYSLGFNKSVSLSKIMNNDSTLNEIIVHEGCSLVGFKNYLEEYLFMLNGVLITEESIRSTSHFILGEEQGEIEIRMWSFLGNSYHFAPMDVVKEKFSSSNENLAFYDSW